MYIVLIFQEIIYVYPDSGTDKYVKEAVNRSSSTEQLHKIEIEYVIRGLRLINLILYNYFLLQFCSCFSNEKKIDTIFSVLKNSLKVQCICKTCEQIVNSSYHCSKGTDA